MLSVQRLRVLLLALLVCGVLWPGAARPAVAAPPAQADGDQLNDFLILFPELKRLPAPAWVAEGLRVTYASASATVADNPDNAGGGAGLLQYDVVATERRTVAASVRFYLDLGDGSVQSNFSYGAAMTAGAGDFWLNPTVLAHADDVADDNLSVNQMPYSVAGNDYNAVRFQYEDDKATRVWMFDEATGLLLFYRDEVNIGGNDRQLASMTLAGVRTLALPWKAGPTPKWIAQGDIWNYIGNFTTRIPGSPETPLGLASSVEMTTVRPRWTRATIQISLAGQPSNVADGLTGAAQLSNGYWLPAAALTARPRRAIIDRDPLTGIAVRFTRNANGTITLTETGAAEETQYVYDGETGQLLALQQQKQLGIAINVYTLELTQ